MHEVISGVFKDVLYRGKRVDFLFSIYDNVLIKAREGGGMECRIWSIRKYFVFVYAKLV